MLIVTTNEIPGKKVNNILGIVQGNVVQSKHIGRDLGASLKTLVGGEIQGYSELMTESRSIAMKRMIEESETMGANAILAMRYQTSQVMNGASEVISYGTAVVVE